MATYLNGKPVRKFIDLIETDWSTNLCSNILKYGWVGDLTGLGLAGSRRYSRVHRTIGTNAAMLRKENRLLMMLLAGLMLLFSVSVRAQTTPLSDLDALRYIASHPDLIAAFGANAANGRSHYETAGIKEGRKITFVPLNYTASHPDLIAAFGVDEPKAVTHYIQAGFKEGRKVTFDPAVYLSLHSDLRAAFGTDLAAAARHYIQTGYKEGRPTTGATSAGLSDLDALRYIASHPDLIAAFGANAANGRSHYENAGIKEGRKITFEPLNYTASHPDLMAAFGVDETKAVTHYIQAGFKEGRRVTFNPLNYIASHPDLIAALGADGAKGARHYIQAGYTERRQITFDPVRYLASHPDLIELFLGDETKAATHYIQAGFKEKRQVTFSDLDALQYVASFADLIQSVGLNVRAAILHYINIGYNEGRRILFDALAYIASYGDLIRAFGTNAFAAVQHYIGSGYAEGRRIIFDAVGYLANHADLRAAFGNNLAAATRHYINFGFQEGRTYDFSVSGNVQVSGIFQVDSDTNDTNAPQIDNDAPAEAQNLVAPFTLVGNVNRARQGDKRGKWYELGDLDDVFKVTLRKGQQATLNVAATSVSAGDIGLELYDSKVTLISGIQAYSRVHRVTAPADGDYFVAVRARGGSSRYTLEVSTFIPTAAASLPTSAFSDPEFIPGELLVSFKDKRAVSTRELEVIAASDSGEVNAPPMTYTIRDDLGQNLYTTQIKTNVVEGSYSNDGGSVLIPGGQFRDSVQEEKYLTVLAAHELAQDRSVNHVSLNYIMQALALPNDPMYGNQKWHYELLKMPAAWDVTKGSQDVVVAVLDTGVIRHQDLIDNLLPGYDFVARDAGGDNDGPDEDASDPGALQTNVNTPRRSHGTHVAGTIAARGNNAIGGTGVSWNTKILPVRVLAASGYGSIDDIIKGMKYAAGLLSLKPTKVANILNMSLGGGEGCPPAYQEVVNQVRAAGVIIVAAAGNDHIENTIQFGRDWVGSPGSCTGVVTVAAQEPSGATAKYSQEGPSVDVAAPGGALFDGPRANVFSTDMYRLGGGITKSDYTTKAGTSMAAPHVAGVVALMKALKPSLTPAEFDGLLASGQLTDDLVTCSTFVDPMFESGTKIRRNCGLGKDIASGYGVLNAFSALKAVSPPAAVPPPPRIDITPGVIDFGTGISQQDLFLTVIGEGRVTQVATSTSGESWLTLSRATQINPYTVRFTATVNRDLVASGAYSGALTFRGIASGESLNTVNVPVYFSKPAATLLGNAGTQYALLIDPISFDAVFDSSPFQTKENASTYVITGVKKGSYYVVAGTDVDNNNFICEESEICSFYQVNTGNSDEIIVNGPVTKVALRAEVIQGVSTQAASAGDSTKTGGGAQLGISRKGAVSASAVERLLRAVEAQGGAQVSDAVVYGRQ